MWSVAGRGLVAYLLLLATVLRISTRAGNSGSPCSHFKLKALERPSRKFGGTVDKITVKFHNKAVVGHRGPTSCSTVSSLSFVFSINVALGHAAFGDNPGAVDAGGASLSCVDTTFHLHHKLKFSFNFIPCSDVKCGCSRAQGLSGSSRCNSAHACAGACANGKNVGRICIKTK